MPILRNIGKLATCRAGGGQGELHVQSNAALAWDGSEISWVGPDEALPTSLARLESLDAAQKLVLPGLIDCHTHLAFGGFRVEEFVDRIRGRTYMEIARAGRGIASTVRATRAANETELTEKCLAFLKQMAALGITTVECKSGYGLTTEDELKLLRVYRELGRRQPLTIVPTFLGAHVVPAEMERSGYLRLLTDVMIPRAAKEGLAEFCDVFLEDSAFGLEEAREILRVAVGHGLKPKIHADQFSDGGGALLAAEENALSADHLESSSLDGLSKMRDAGVVAVALPIASLYTFQQPLDVRKLIDLGVEVAVASDFNPGSAPSFHLPLALLLACTLSRMTPAEAVKGATFFGAKAIGRSQELGSLEPGKRADFILIDSPTVDHWLYHFRGNACLMTVKNGQVIHDARHLST